MCSRYAKVRKRSACYSCSEQIADDGCSEHLCELRTLPFCLRAENAFANRCESIYMALWIVQYLRHRIAWYDPLRNPLFRWKFAMIFLFAGIRPLLAGAQQQKYWHKIAEKKSSTKRYFRTDGILTQHKCPNNSHTSRIRRIRDDGLSCIHNIYPLTGCIHSEYSVLTHVPS